VEKMSFELEELREKITGIDNEILELLEDRMELSKEVAEVKKENNMFIEDLNREDEIIGQRKLHTSLEEDFVESLMKVIIKESKKIQTKIMNEDE